MLRKIPAPSSLQQQTGFSYEPQPGETEAEHHLFLEFLSTAGEMSPAQWIKERNLGTEALVTAKEQMWLQRRIDYWRHHALAQRNAWVRLLTKYRKSLEDRMEYQTERIQRLTESERNGEIDGMFDKAVSTFNADMRVALEVVKALNEPNDGVVVINQAVASVGSQNRDITSIAKSWDEASRNVIAGHATVKSREAGS